MMVRQDKSGVLVFIVIGVSRAMQGACTGLFFVIVQVNVTGILCLSCGHIVFVCRL